MESRFNYRDDVVTPEVISKLSAIEGIDSFFVSSEAVDEISDILELDNYSDTEELRAIRNSVVKNFNSIIKVLIYLKNNRTGIYTANVADALRDVEADMTRHMSAVVAVIDDRMYNIDPHSV